MKYLISIFLIITSCAYGFAQISTLDSLNNLHLNQNQAIKLLTKDDSTIIADIDSLHNIITLQSTAMIFLLKADSALIAKTDSLQKQFLEQRSAMDSLSRINLQISTKGDSLQKVVSRQKQELDSLFKGDSLIAAKIDSLKKQSTKQKSDIDSLNRLISQITAKGDSLQKLVLRQKVMIDSLSKVDSGMAAMIISLKKKLIKNSSTDKNLCESTYLKALNAVENDFNDGENAGQRQEGEHNLANNNMRYVNCTDKNNSYLYLKEEKIITRKKRVPLYNPNAAEAPKTNASIPAVNTSTNSRSSQTEYSITATINDKGDTVKKDTSIIKSSDVSQSALVTPSLEARKNNSTVNAGNSLDSTTLYKVFKQTTITKFYLDDNNSLMQSCRQYLSAYTVSAWHNILVSYTLKGKDSIIIKDPVPFSGDTIQLESSVPNSPYNKYCSGEHFFTVCPKVKKYLIKKIKYARGRLRGIVGFGGAPSFAFRQLVINNPQYANTGVYDQRRNNEGYTIGGSANLYLGLAKNGHYLCLDGIFMQQGFSSTNTQLIDWRTGLLGNNSAINSTTIYQMRSAGVGLEYSFRPYKEGVQPVFTGGVYYLHAFQGNIADSIYTQSNIRVNIGGFKLGAGISYRPSYLFELRIQPIIYYDFSFARATEIKTRFYNPGLEVTIMLNSKCLNRIK